MPDDERRVAHHVVEYASSLKRAAPEPRHVRSAVLLRRAREIRTSRRRGTARPEQRVPSLHLRREDLVLEVAGGELGALGERFDLLRFGHVARERFLAGEP